MSDIQTMSNNCVAFVRQNLKECCAELIEWQDTAVLRDGKVRELAKIAQGFIADHDALKAAEAIINRVALELATSTSIGAKADSAGWARVPTSKLTIADCYRFGLDIDTVRKNQQPVVQSASKADATAGDRAVAFLTLGGIDGGEYDDNDIEIASSRLLEELQQALVRTSEPVTLELIVRPTDAQSVRDAAIRVP